MTTAHSQPAPTRYVVVHGGARDSYQVAVALQRAGLLHALITDLIAPADAKSGWARFVPGRILTLLQSRTASLPSACVHACWVTGLLATVSERCAWLPFTLRRAARRLSDARLGNVAGRLARRTGSGLLAYSYFGEPAFRAFGRPALLFQVHPHPLTVRRILQQERTDHPECAASLDQEWELALPEHDLQSLVRESQGASAYLAASSFTRQSLVEHGVPPAHIHVVPYGVDLQRFHPDSARTAATGRLNLLFVGRINQRKGMLYLLQALERLSDLDVQLTVCGRVVDDLQLFRGFGDRVVIRPSVSDEDLVRAYQQADLFVFPSVAEGFGQVLLEALACGLPILSTTHTAAPDLIDDGVEGWIVPPRNVEQLVDRIRWAAAHPAVLHQMRTAARQRAEQYTWQRFHDGIVHFLRAQTPGLSTDAPHASRELVSA